MKVLKVEQIVELLNGTFAYNSRQVPPRPNGNILKVSFFQGCGFCIHNKRFCVDRPLV
jgi:hypothetical protein